MTSKDFAIGLSENLYDGESVNDLVAMIDIFTIQRGIKHNTEPTTGDYLYSATVLCVILTPCKPPEYKEAAQELRRVFAGISSNEDMQNQFANIISKDALNLTTIDELTKVNFYQLFNIDLGHFGYME